jgi:hypothetical protein
MGCGCCEMASGGDADVRISSTGGAAPRHEQVTGTELVRALAPRWLATIPGQPGQALSVCRFDSRGSVALELDLGPGDVPHAGAVLQYDAYSCEDTQSSSRHRELPPLPQGAVTTPERRRTLPCCPRDTRFAHGTGCRLWKSWAPPGLDKTSPLLVRCRRRHCSSHNFILALRATTGG